MDKLDIVNLSKSYEGSPLLSRVSLSVRSGEILCLLGNSGSGKSTLLRLIAGIEKADAGQILWNGEDIADIPTYQRNFGLMFQDYALFPHLTVTENIAFGLRMRDMPKEKISEKVHAALDQVNMVGFETPKCNRSIWGRAAAHCPGARPGSTARFVDAG